MDVCFECTQCGKCCHDVRLTLSVDEALIWAGRGHTVQLLVEALPENSGQPAGSEAEAYDRARSFVAKSGEIPIRIAVILVAYHVGGCPHLRADMLCGNYEDRPRICRIYPLNSRPSDGFDRSRKLCPPQAWTGDRPDLIKDGKITDAEGAHILAEHRRFVGEDVRVLEALARILGLTEAAFAYEGLATYTPAPPQLVDALCRAKLSCEELAEAMRWTIVTNRRSTLAMLAEVGCDAAIVTGGAGYLGSFADDL